MKNKFLKKITSEGKNLLFNTIFVILNVLVVVIFYKNSKLALFLLLAIAIIGLFKWKSKLTLILFILAGLFGPILESIAINVGAWEYSISEIMSVPFWLSILWGNAAALIYQTSREIKKLGVKELK